MKAVPSLSSGAVQKSIRLKKVRINGVRARCDTRLAEGDLVRLYINDELLAPAAPPDAWRKIGKPELDILYEDRNLILIDKKPGLSVQPDRNDTVNTLASRLKAYLFLKGEWSPEEENAFAPALCNRIDRNTGGIVIAAKNAEALRILNEKIKARELKKEYLCILHGGMEPKNGRLRHYLIKDERNNLVRVFDAPAPGALEAVTVYRTLETRGALSLAECELVTGRTHQIRAQFAHCGHPLLGDCKYGTQRLNRPYGVFFQALLSYRLTFDFKTPAGPLAYLDKKAFTLNTGDFIRLFNEKSGLQENSKEFPR